MMDFKQFLDEAGGNKKDNPFMYSTTMPWGIVGIMCIVILRCCFSYDAFRTRHHILFSLKPLGLGVPY